MQRGKASCDDGGIEWIGLGQLSLGAGEAAHPCRIEKIVGKRQPIEQDGKLALVTARRLEADPQAGRAGQPGQLATEHGKTCLAVGDAPQRSGRMKVNNEFVVGNIDADKEVGL